MIDIERRTPWPRSLASLPALIVCALLAIVALGCEREAVVMAELRETGAALKYCSSGASCNDGNPCTVDICDATKCGPTGCGDFAGACTNTPKAGLACSPSDACFSTGVCDAGGACAPSGAPKTCASPPSCHHGPGICSAGACNYPVSAGATCDDGNACTTGETCSSTGVCSSGKPVVCVAKGPCFDAGVCVAGACTNPPKSVLAACDDGDACTLGDKCDGKGACQAGAPKACPSQGPCKSAAFCAAGNCIALDQAKGTVCSDGNGCTSGDTCDGSGSCVSGPSVVCASSGACQKGVCVDLGGTQHTCATAPNPGAACSDGVICTVNDTCDALGQCKGTPYVCAGTACTTGSCVPGIKGHPSCAQTPVADGAGCDDGSACTNGDSCVLGVCKGNPIPVDDGNPCTVDSCDAIGHAAHAPVAAGGPCDDNNVCTIADQCDGAGNCQSSPAPPNTFCGDSCTSFAVCTTTGGSIACSPGAKNVDVTCGYAPPVEPAAPVWPAEPIPTGHGGAFGALAGAFRVSGSGAASYSIPIDVPTGRAGVQPSLALSFDSDLANGIAGVGFSLSGGSSISRCPRTVAQDGINQPPRFDDGDVFCWEGRRLVPTSGENGQDGTQYRTSPETFARVTSFRTAGAKSPTTFLVTTKEGMTYEFGARRDGSDGAGALAYARGGVARSWGLHTATDRSGNYLEWAYATVGTDFTSSQNPTSVSYTGNVPAGALPTRGDVRLRDAPGPHPGLRAGDVAVERPAAVPDQRVRPSGAADLQLFPRLRGQRPVPARERAEVRGQR